MTKEKNIQVNIFETMLPTGEVQLNPELQAIDKIIDEDPSIFNEVKQIFIKRQPRSKTLGRPSTAVEVILRFLILKHLFCWSLRMTIGFVKDSISLRYFTRVYLDPIPHYSVLSRYEKLIPPETIKELNKKIVKIAKKHKITKGRKMRVDTTVVETNIHYPTDSSLLSDGIRVVTRINKKLKKAGIVAGEMVRDVSRRVKRRVLNIIKFARAKSETAEAAFQKTYKELIDITNDTIRRANEIKRTVVNRARHLGDEAIKTAKKAKEQLDHYIPLIEKVIHQAESRILHDESVPNTEKIISIFEPHSYVVRKGKRNKPNEFGKVVKIQEADGKIITDFESYPVNVADPNLFIPSVEKHIEIFERPPDLAAGDRGFYSQENEEKAYQLGVKRVCLPKKGNKSKERKALEKSRWFKAGQRFRAGCEGKISVLKRCHGLDRCLNKGENGFDQWIGWGIIASNLKVIANS